VLRIATAEPKRMTAYPRRATSKRTLATSAPRRDCPTNCV
jgi:hypothetical protein